MLKTPTQKILVVDFGAQYNQLIARKVREGSVYCEIVPYWITPAEVKKHKPKGLIFSGGPSSVHIKDAPLPHKGLLDLGLPILGICYGMQILGEMLGGKIGAVRKREFGRTELTVDKENVLFEGLLPKLTCWMSHGDSVRELPPGFEIFAHTYNTKIASMGDGKRSFYGVQFHPEVVHTPWGIDLIKNFLYRVCKCEPNWTPANFINISVDGIKGRVKRGRVLCALSGGVDSAVTAALAHLAVGKQLNCILVDHGFMRLNEAKQVRQTFKDYFGMELIVVNAQKRFLSKIKGVTEPEIKRKIIGNEFIHVFEEEARKLGKFHFLAQGTLYPDIIESAATKEGQTAQTIKTHHNVGGLPEDMDFELIEPLRFLFKDEVRLIARELGLPPHMAYRQPFPGPGLAIRIIGEVTKERIDILQKADAIFLDEIYKANLHKEIWQFFAVLPDIRSVGVMGDQRTYEYPIVLRAVTSEDGMTCDWARIPQELLEKISNRIVNEVKGINRVVYDITSKPPGTIEWE